jgi:hypothetical protein
MNTQNILQDLRKVKDTAKKNFLSAHFPEKKSQLLIGICLEQKETLDFLLKGIEALGYCWVVLWSEEIHGDSVVSQKCMSENDLPALDCIIWDGDCEGIDIMKYSKFGIIPILPKKNIYSGVFLAFNPMKFEGNSFLYENENPYCIFERFVAYTENIRFPEDKRILLKNIMSAF